MTCKHFLGHIDGDLIYSGENVLGIVLKASDRLLPSSSKEEKEDKAVEEPKSCSCSPLNCPVKKHQNACLCDCHKPKKCICGGKNDDGLPRLDIVCPVCDEKPLPEIPAFKAHVWNGGSYRFCENCGIAEIDRGYSLPYCIPVSGQKFYTKAEIDSRMLGLVSVLWRIYERTKHSGTSEDIADSIQQFKGKHL